MSEYGVMVEWYWQGKTEVLGEKHYTDDSTEENPVPVPFCPPQIPRGLAWGGTQAFAVKNRQLTPRASPRPNCQ